MLNARDPQGLAREAYDLVIVGGGIYGIMLALEAARRSLRPILVERQDFAGATSANSLRIIHGGLRYLQTLDLPRFLESVAERRWFLRHLPDHVQPLPCLMPLYGDGLRRPSVMRAALALNDMLSPWRNAGVRMDRRLPPGRVLDARATREQFPVADPSGLKGAALWYDAFSPNVPRLLIELLSWACAHGARALNYVEATGVLECGGGVDGVRAVDRARGTAFEFRAPVVVNAAGPWSPAFAAASGVPHDALFVPSLAWNVVFDRDPPCAHGLAVTPRRPGAKTYFLVPWKGVLLAGTGYAPWSGGPEDPHLPAELLRAFLADLNQALPNLDLSESDVARTFVGLLPARHSGSADLTARPVIVDHKALGGPAGLFSLSGIKLTTSRRVADTVMSRAFPAARPVPYEQLPRPHGRVEHPDYSFRWMPSPDDDGWRQPLSRAVAGEAVVHLDDLLLRRSSLGDNPGRAAALAAAAAALFDWDRERRDREVAAFRHSLAAPQGA